MTSAEPEKQTSRFAAVRRGWANATPAVIAAELGPLRPGPMNTLVTGLAAHPELDGGLSVHQMFRPAVVQFDTEGNHRGDLVIDVQNPFAQAHRVLAWDGARRLIYALTVAQGEPDSRVDRLDLSADPLTLVTVARGGGDLAVPVVGPDDNDLIKVWRVVEDG